MLVGHCIGLCDGLFLGPGHSLVDLQPFLFHLSLPPSSSPSIDFGNGLARIRYEVCSIDVLQRYPGGINATGTREGVLILTCSQHQRTLLSVKVARSGYKAVSSEACWW